MAEQTQLSSLKEKSAKKHAVGVRYVCGLTQIRFTFGSLSSKTEL